MRGTLGRNMNALLAARTGRARPGEQGTASLSRAYQPTLRGGQYFFLWGLFFLFARHNTKHSFTGSSRTSSGLAVAASPTQTSRRMELGQCLVGCWARSYYEQLLQLF